MPDFIKPTHLQRTVPHPAWIDTVIWPEIRDEIIRNMDWGQFEEFQKVTGAGISVGWPYADSGAFIESPDRQLLMLNPIFKAHIQDSKHWKVSGVASNKFPFLKPYCTLNK